MRFLLVLLPLLAAGVVQGQEPVHVVTEIDLPGNNAAAGVQVLKLFAAATLKEKDCLRFEMLQQNGRPNHLTVVAVWRDQSAFEAHDSAPYTIEFRAIMQPLIGSPWDERLLKLIKP